MEYTLYIDESGDFETSRGQWVLAGVLLEKNYENCERILNTGFSKLPAELGLKSRKQFHLTEFRKKFQHKTACEMAQKLLDKLDALSVKSYFLVTINNTKTSLSNKEKTYRLMLADLLALCETSVPDDQNISKLDLVVASRTINGELQTSLSHIDNEIVKSLPVALEAGLATKGMVNLIGKRLQVHMDFATNSWGLVSADFIANLSYHNREPREQSILRTLTEKGKYSLFESFGGFDVRKANIAERDQNYVLALYRWLIIGFRNAHDQVYAPPVQRLLTKIFKARGTSGSVPAFQGLLERVWRNHQRSDQYTVLASILMILDEQLSLFTENNPDFRHWICVFELRNLILLADNHRARTQHAKALVISQNEAVSELIANPEYFSKVLDFKAREIELHVNCLDFELAQSLAEKNDELISTYREVWQLLTEQDNKHTFEKSRINIRAKMILLRTTVLSIGSGEISRSSDCEGMLDRIGLHLTHPSDLSRFRNYRAMFLLKTDKYEEAISCFYDSQNKGELLQLNEFDFYWFLKSINQSKLEQNGVSTAHLDKAAEYHLKSIDLTQRGHPFDLLLRETALFEFLRGDKKQAKLYLKRGKKSDHLGTSEISTWLEQMSKIYEDFINGSTKSKSEYFENLIGNPLVKRFNEDDPSGCPLKMVRNLSPY
jgi:hypothetical protein